MELRPDGSALIAEVPIWRHDPAFVGISAAIPRALLAGLHPLLSITLEAFGTHPAAAQESGFDLSGGAFNWTATHVTRDIHAREHASVTAIFSGRILPDAWNFRGVAGDAVRLAFDISGDMTGFTVEGAEVRLRVTARPAADMSCAAFEALARRLTLRASAPELTDDD